MRSCHILELNEAAFWHMLGRIPTVATSILRTMAEPVQESQSMSQQREKLIELGTLAAGLAHELDRPALACQQIKHLDQILQGSAVLLEQPAQTPAERGRTAGGD